MSGLKRPAEGNADDEPNGKKLGFHVIRPYSPYSAFLLEFKIAEISWKT